MNAVSTEFAIFEDEPALASAATAAAASRAAGLGVRPPDGRVAAEHGDAMSSLLHHIHPGASSAGSSMFAELRDLKSETPVVVLLFSEKRDAPIAAVGLKAMDLFHKPWFEHVMSDPRRPMPQTTASPPMPIKYDGTARPVEATHKSEKESPASLGLTLRQAEVLALIAQGKPNKLICRELRLAEGTVKCHVSAILRALCVSTRTQAAVKVSRMGLL